MYKQGGTCVMVNLMAAGMAGMIDLGSTRTTIHAHRAGWGASQESLCLGGLIQHGQNYGVWPVQITCT